MLRSVDISVMNTEGADDDIENSDDEDDSNGDIVEDRGGLVVFRVVDVQTGQHQKQYPCQDLKDKRNQYCESSIARSKKRDKETWKMMLVTMSTRRMV